MIWGMAAAPRVARLTRPLGRLSGLTPWQRPLRPLRTIARRVLLGIYPPESAERYAGVVAPVAGGLKMRLDPRSYIEWEVLFAGYEPEVRELLRRALRPGDVAIDVGANAGAHTLAMAAAGARVLACEPNPTLRARLEANVALNGLETVTVRPYALTAVAGPVTLHVPADPVHTGGASLLAGVHEHLRDAGQIQVEGVPLDKLVRREQLTAVRLVKIDVEGFEAAVLAGGRELLERERPDLALEYTHEWWQAAGASLESVLDGLRGLGYDVLMVTWRGLRPIPDPAPDRMNLWATARRARRVP
jgi:FkbM family methyltransferase